VGDIKGTDLQYSFAGPGFDSASLLDDDSAQKMVCFHLELP